MPDARLLPSCYFRVFRRVDFPIAASVGDYLAVMPPVFEHNLWVLSCAGLWVVRRRHFEEGKLWTELAAHIAKGALIQLPREEAPRLTHPVTVADESHRPGLRLIRSG